MSPDVIFLIIEMAGSTGTYVKRALISYDEMHSPCSNWMDLMCSKSVGYS